MTTIDSRAPAIRRTPVAALAILTAAALLVALAVALASTGAGDARAGGASGGVLRAAPAHGTAAGRLLAQHRLHLIAADRASAESGR